ncbi:hypothetical protein Tco_1303309 [Tanacetum coccineum]
MVQSQRPAGVHQDKLCPPNKTYALMDANKKVDLENPLCQDESRILKNILQNHPLRFSIAASLLVPWIYLGQFLHTLQEDGSKNKLKFMLDRKELTLTLDDFGTIFHLPQATDNNHDHFVPAPKFSEMVPFYINNLELLWEGFHYSLKNPTTMIPYPRFTKLIMSHYMTAFPEILRRVRDRYHNLEDDVMIKSIFSSGKSTNVGTHRITSAPRTPNPEITEGESSTPQRSTVIRLRIPPRRSTRLTPLTLITTTDEADDLVLQDTVQHVMPKEIEKLVEGSENVEENVEVASSPLRNDDNQTNPGTRLEPRSDKESPEVEKIVDISQPVNVIEEEEESAEDDY